MTVHQGQHGGPTDERWQQRGPNGSRDHTGARLATGLGWFSVGLGLAQIATPGGLARMIGVRPDARTRTVMRTVGMREFASGAGILSRPRPAGWVWARLGGDAIDLMLLGRALRSDKAQKSRVAAATAAVIGITALDLLDAQRLRRTSNGSMGGTTADGVPRRTDGATRVVRALTINRRPEEVYRFWRNFENLPRFMTHLESVQVISERRSHWQAKAPAGRSVEWDAEIAEDRPNELIAWRSLPGADVKNSGSVRFTHAPGGRGTEVRVELQYSPPAGALGALVAKLFGEEPDLQLHDDLRRLKQVLEVGEVVRSEGSPEGARIERQLRQRPARPLATGAGR